MAHYENRDIRVEELRPYKNNPRNNDNAVPDVKRSIGEFDFVNPIIVSPDMEIICGHTRYRAALELGLETVPCRVVNGLSDQKMRKLRIVDNRTAEKAEWKAELMVEIEDIQIDPEEYDFDELIAEFKGLDDDMKKEFDEVPKPSRQEPDALKAMIVIPPRLWLTSKDTLARTFDALASEHGVTIRWPEGNGA